MNSENRNFSRVGGHLSLDFVNSRPMGPNGPVEKLNSGDDLVQWALEVGLVTVDEAVTLEITGGEIGRFHELRDCFRLALEAGLTSPFESDELVHLINRALRERPPLRKLARTSCGEFLIVEERAIASAADLLAAIAVVIAEFIAEDGPSRSSRCAGEACVLWFLDETRNHSRQWCSMTTCGGRAKSKRYYQRKKMSRA